MGTLSRLYDFQPETVIKSQEVDDEINQILSEINGNISTVNIADLAITAAKIVSGAVGTTHLASGAVTNDKIGSGAVDTDNIQDAAINNAKLGLLAVQTGNIVDDAVSTDKIGNLAVTSTKISSSAITNSKIATGAVTADKIQNDSISGDKIINGSIDVNELADNSVSSVKIQNNAVIGTKLPTNVITSDKINAGAVINDKIGSSAVTGVKIQDLAISTAKLENGAVTTDKITNSAVTSQKIADGNVINSKIGGGAVNTSQLATGAVDYNKFSSNVAGQGLEYDVLNRANGIYINNDIEFFTYKAGTGELTLADGNDGAWDTGISKVKMRPSEIEPATLIIASDIGTAMYSTNQRYGLHGLNVPLKDSDNAQYTAGSQWAEGEWNSGDGLIIDSYNEGDYLVEFSSWLQGAFYYGETFALTIAVDNVDYLQCYQNITMDYNDPNLHAVFAVGACPIGIRAVIPNLVNGNVVNIKVNLLSDTSHSYHVRLAGMGNLGNDDTPPFGAMLSFHRITFSQP